MQLPSFITRIILVFSFQSTVPSDERTLLNCKQTEERDEKAVTRLSLRFSDYLTPSPKPYVNIKRLAQEMDEGSGPITRLASAWDDGPEWIIRIALSGGS